MKRKELDEPRNVQSYSPNRLEYFAGHALQGLIAGRSEKDLKKSAARALALANEMEEAIDSQENN